MKSPQRRALLGVMRERERETSADEKGTYSETNIDPFGLSFTFHELQDFAADIRNGASPRFTDVGGMGLLSSHGWYGLDFIVTFLFNFCNGVINLRRYTFSESVRGWTYDNEDRDANDRSHDEVYDKRNYCVFLASPPAGPLPLDIRIRKGCRLELGLRGLVVGEGGGRGVHTGYGVGSRGDELGALLRAVLLIESIEQDHGRETMS